MVDECNNVSMKYKARKLRVKLHYDMDMGDALELSGAESINNHEVKSSSFGIDFGYVLPSKSVVTPQLQIQKIANGRRIFANSMMMFTSSQFTFSFVILYFMSIGYQLVFPAFKISSSGDWSTPPKNCSERVLSVPLALSSFIASSILSLSSV